MARTKQKAAAGTDLAAAGRESRDLLANMADVAESFSAFRPQAEVLRRIEAVPTIFPWFDHETGVGGLPISRFTLVHGPSNEGKTEFCLGLGRSFLARNHFFGLVDAERTTPQSWVADLMGSYTSHPGFSALPVGTYEQVRGGVRDYCERIANARERGKLLPDTSALIVVDSIRKLVPKKLFDELAKAVAADEDEAKSKGGRFGKKAAAGVDGIGGRAGQIKAAMNAAWVDELIPLLADTRTAMVVIARETVNPNADPWDERPKTGGGSALFYEASLDLRISRRWVTVDKLTVGEAHKIEIGKTKIAGKVERTPVAYFHTGNGMGGSPKGFDVARDLVELGKVLGVLSSSGSWLSFDAGGVKVGNGVEAAVARLRDDRDLLAAIETECRLISAKLRVDSRQL